MIKVLAYFLTTVYFIFFGLTLLIFHLIQWICLNIFGYNAHKSSVDLLNFCLMKCMHLLGVRYKFSNTYKIPGDRPTILVANHQSMSDIPPIIWYMRKHHPKFISKKELGRGIPSVSYNLRHGGSVLIDRKDPVKSIRAISEFAQKVNEKQWGAVIFPEGTRSRDGKPKPFKRKGLEALIRDIPEALVIPISINNSWKTLKYGKFPMGLGALITLTVHEPIQANALPPDLLIDKIENQIVQNISYE